MAKVGPDYPRQTIPHMRIVAGGTLGSAQQEIWTCTLKVASFPIPTGGITQVLGLLEAAASGALADLEGLLSGGQQNAGLVSYANDHAIPAWKTLMGAVGQSSANLTYVKVNAYGADDKQLNGTTVDIQFSPVSGGSAGASPFTMGLVTEFRTSHKSRGTGSHGRMTLPAGVGVDANGQINFVGHGTLEVAQTAVLTFLSSLNATSGTSSQFLPAIIYTKDVGRTYQTASVDRSPVAFAIDTVLCSSLPGIVRRRGNKLKQTGVKETVNYGAVTAP